MDSSSTSSATSETIGHGAVAGADEDALQTPLITGADLSERELLSLDQAKGKGILLFDGDCAMCNGFVQRFVTCDPTQEVRYAPLQGFTATEVFKRHNLSRDNLLGGVRLVQNFRKDDERVLIGSDAVLTALGLTHSAVRHLAYFRLVPQFLREWVYGKIAANRYRLAGKVQQCAIPQPSQKHLFLP